MQMRPKIGIIISTTRAGRFADVPTNWLFNIAKVRTDADFEIVDLRDYPMPFFEEKAPGAAAERGGLALGQEDRQPRRLHIRYGGI